MLEIFARNDFFFLKYPSTTRAFWRIKLNQWDFRTRVIMTNTSLTIGLQVPHRLNCVTHHLTHLNWNTEGADYMVTSVRQTSNQARLKQLLIKTNKLLIVKLSLGNTLYKNVMWASNLEHKNCTFLILYVTLHPEACLMTKKLKTMSEHSTTKQISLACKY